MKGAKLTRMISSLLVAIMLLSCLPITSASAATSAELKALISQAESLRDGNSYFPMQVSNNNGSDVNPAHAWVTADEMDAFKAAISAAKNASNTDKAYNDLSTAIELFKSQMKSDDSDPYFRVDPGMGPLPVEIAAPTNEWKTRRPLDNRVPTDFAGGTMEMVDYPFADSNGKPQLLQINYVHNGRSTFGGITYESPLNNSVSVPAGATIEFDVYYPKSSQGKFMRFRMRNGNSDIDSYLREYDYTNLNPDWIGNYMGETWLKTHVSANATTGNSSTFILELHGENGRPAETSTLLIGDLKITAPDTNTAPLPMVQNKENQSAVAPLKSVYNEENGLFMVGAIGTGNVTGVRARHYSIFVDGNNLKAEGTHPRAPKWLTDVNGSSWHNSSSEGINEYSIPTSSYQAIRDSGEPGEYHSHAHVLAWYNQAPNWMRYIIPENLNNGYVGDVNFFGLGNGVPAVEQLRKVDEDMAKRVQFNHVVYVMRHFLTTDAKYGSSVSRGVIPFHSWDVLNEEVHESRHSQLIPEDETTWRDALKHTNWLVAMSGDDIDGDITEHYIYLLFKYAHIAAPNALMAEKYKANYDSLPEYMKMDGHDQDGSIDAYIQDNPPALTYNDYGTSSHTKSRVMYNMVKALNTAWQSDPLYDGRPLIEVVGFQGHDSVSPTLASDNQYAMSLFASLIDQGLLSGISFSEFDLKLLTDAPGGGATAPAALNVRQSDALGYEYGLMYKLFTKFADYVDHIISWGTTGSGWQGSYVLFDQQSNANAGYYAAMDPDKFIAGHSYLDYYFEGEYDKLAEDYVIKLDGLGNYTPKSAPKPVVIQGLKDKTIECEVGDRVLVFANANHADSYQWTVDGPRARAYTQIEGATGRAYYITVTAEMNASKYRAIITNENGTTYGPVYTLKVSGAPTPLPIVVTPAQSVTLYVGETAELSVTASNAEYYQWYINRNDGKGYVALEGATSSTYTTSTVDESCDGFTYRCTVSNYAGSVDSAVITLHVSVPTPPETGDNFNLPLWMALCVVCAGAVVLLGKKQQKAQ